MINFITEDMLDKLSIFQLRNLSRELGHNSPTDKKKAELIGYVLGLKELPDPVNAPPVRQRRGRPPKEQGRSALDKLVQEYLARQGKVFVDKHPESTPLPETPEQEAMEKDAACYERVFREIEEWLTDEDRQAGCFWILGI